MTSLLADVLKCVVAILCLGPAQATAQVLPADLPAVGLYTTGDPANRFGTRLPMNDAGVWREADGLDFGLRAIFGGEMRLGAGATAKVIEPVRVSVYLAGFLSIDGPAADGLGLHALEPTRFDAPDAEDGVGLIKRARLADGQVPPIELPVSVIAPRWDEYADYENGAAPCAGAAHQVWMHQTILDGWRAMIVTWEEMAKPGCDGPPSTFQAVILKNPAPAAGAGEAVIEFRYETCPDATSAPGLEAVGGRSGLMFANGQTVELLGRSGEYPDHIDGSMGPAGGLSGDPVLFSPYCLQSNVKGADQAPRSGVYRFDVGVDGVSLFGDVDGDGVGDGNDNCPEHYNPRQGNLDSDRRGDLCDDDQDEDNLPFDMCPRACPGGDRDFDGLDDACDTDVDNDGIVDLVSVYNGWIVNDVCPSFPDPAQADENEDGIGDACVGDPEAEITSHLAGAVPILVDTVDGPRLFIDRAYGNLIWNKPPEDPLGQPRLQCIEGPDQDGDHAEYGVNAIDNCPTVFNPHQLDHDADGIGDVCDRDRDDDGHDNRTLLKPWDVDQDNCPWDSNPDQLDFDENGIGDACEGADGLTRVSFLTLWRWLADEVPELNWKQPADADPGALMSIMLNKTTLGDKLLLIHINEAVAGWTSGTIQEYLDLLLEAESE